MVRIVKKEVGKAWYLTHFLMKQSRFRIVYDGYTISNGVRINDEIMTGPDLPKSFVFCVKKIQKGMQGFYV